MATTAAVIRARVDPALKVEAESVFRELGLSISEAISLFYQQVKAVKGLPFEVRAVPNATTLQAFRDTDAGQQVVRCQDAQDMFDRLGI